MRIKLLEKKEKRTFHSTELSSSSFWKNENTPDTRIKREIDAEFAKRWWINITFKKMKLYKNLSKLKNFFITHMKTKRIELTNYFFFRRVFTVLSSNCICDHSRQTFKHVLLFCANRFEKRQRMLRKKKRRT
jgi:hypothetical protein